MVSGAFVVAACRTPGAGFEEAGDGTNGTSTVNPSATPTNTSATIGSATDGAEATATSDGTAMGTSAGDSTGGAAATNDVSVTNTVSSSDGSGGATTGETNETNSTSDTSGTSGGTPGSNLIDNGDFQTDSATCEADDSDWFTEGTLNWSGADDVVCGYCIVLESDQSGQLNWSGNAGTPPTLEGGQSYSFSFDVFSNEGAAPSLTAKVGQPVEPYDAYLEQEVSVPASSETQSFTFSMTNTDQVGVAFFVSVGSEWGKICFDNISIEPL